jgi:hypothetical protein
MGIRWLASFAHYPHPRGGVLAFSGRLGCLIFEDAVAKMSSKLKA